MRVPLKLNAIEQEHLQELYNAAGVARDELPYTEKFEEIWSGFQDRTFKNADHEQVFGALLKYARTGSLSPSADGPAVPLNDEQVKQVKVVLSRPGISSQLVDNLNVSTHLRAVLTDLFLLDEAVKSLR